jgi:anti-anti-sigma factor
VLVVEGFSVELVGRRDGATIVKLSGEVDMACADDVREHLLEVFGDQASLVVDLDGLRYVDSAGIRMLFDLSERLARQDRSLALAVAADAPVRRVLSITRLDTLVPLYDGVEAALVAAGSLRGR